MKWSFLFVGLAVAGGCRRSDPNPAEVRATPGASVAPSPKIASPPNMLELLSVLPQCDVDHQGLFLDLGTTAVDGRRDHAVGPFDDVATSERAGVSVVRLHTKRISYDFLMPARMDKAGVTLRAVAGVSRQVSVYLDDRRLGVAALPREDLGFVVMQPDGELAPGLHSLTLRFGGPTAAADDAYADIDWIRIGPPEGSPASYAPPTLKDIVTDVVLGKEPRRSLVLRSPGSVRCALRVIAGMRLRARLGYWGSGSGVAQVRVLEDGETPVLLAERRVAGGVEDSWALLDESLERFAGRVVGVELRAPESTGGGRVAFGEPAVVTPENAGGARAGPARVAVVVVGAGLDRRLLPPWGPAGGLGGVSHLVRDGVAFDRYRTPTTVVSGVVASLLTGLPPRAHGVEDLQSRLSDEVRLLGERAKESNVHAAFLSGVPMSFPAFGFARGWEYDDAISPVKDLPATEPLTRGLSWLKERFAADKEGRLLLVVHTRGGHPPWDVTRDEVQQLPPEEYGGPLEPRAGALILANLRVLRGSTDQRLTGDDWRRLRALEELALKKQDYALRRIIEFLEKEGLYDDALVILMGDVATGDPPAAPFAPMPKLREDVLMAPLIVKFPRGGPAGRQVGTMATTLDVTATIVGALGLPGDDIEGLDLAVLAAGALPVDGRPLVATLGSRFSTRWGPWLLAGELGRRPTLCLVEVDPSCATDAYTESPLAADALWHRTFEAETRARAVRKRLGKEPLRTTFDAETQSSLKVFGY